MNMYTGRVTGSNLPLVDGGGGGGGGRWLKN